MAWTAAACSGLSAGPLFSDQACVVRRRRRRVGIFGRRRETARHQRAHRRAPVVEGLRQRVARHSIRRANGLKQFALPRRAP
jgi:hypothetical protein